jgi:hypothetical protein
VSIQSCVVKARDASRRPQLGPLDRLCLLARCRPDTAEQLLDDTIAALQDSGDGRHVGCSQGAAWIPSEAASEYEALTWPTSGRMPTRQGAHQPAGRSPTRSCR